MSKTFTQTERTFGKRAETKTGILMVDRTDNKVTLAMGIYRNCPRRSYVETFTLELSGRELKRLRKAIGA